MPDFQQVQSPGVQPAGPVSQGPLRRPAGPGNAALQEQVRAAQPVSTSALSGLRPLFPGMDRTAGGLPVGQLAQQVNAPTPAGPANTTVAPDAGTTAAGIYAKHDKNVDKLSSSVTAAQLEDLKLFKANWQKNQARYEAVAAKTSIPAALVAALHWRESTGDFSTYLHQGDPLGKKAVNEPNNIPIFHKWEEAAVHALTMKDKADNRDALNITTQTKDAASLAAYSEMYNGMGYEGRGLASPYVYSGTDTYTGGKYIRDGVFSRKAKDQQLGVMTMLGSIGGMDASVAKAPVIGPVGWATLTHGTRTLHRGDKGSLVGDLQSRLAKAGFPCGDDRAFGPTVEKTVKAYQVAKGLPDDGVVGVEMSKLMANPAELPQQAPAPAGPTPTGPTPTPAPTPARQS